MENSSFTAGYPGLGRARFAALHEQVEGQPAPLLLDGPGGSQVPEPVVEAMAAYLRRDNANQGGVFPASRRTGELLAAVRARTAAFLGAGRPEEIVFGPNMTTLAFALSHALARTWQPGDEIVLTSLDHDANHAPWARAAAARGVTVRTWDFDPADGCRLDPAALAPLLGARTRLVAVTHASNAVGTLVDVAAVVAAVRAAAPAARVFVDAVHYAPHGPIDVRALGCDFLACSAYKFFGPHLGVLYGKYEHLESLPVDKVRPSPARPPGSWETGTPNFEAVAGLGAALDYLGTLAGQEAAAAAAAPAPGTGRAGSPPAAAGTTADLLRAAMTRVRGHEAVLSRAFLAGWRARLAPRGGVLFGVAEPDQVGARTPTFAFRLPRRSPRETAEGLAAAGISAWDGHLYAVNVVDRLGLADRGGLVRVGFLHYHDRDDVERLLTALEGLV